MATLQPLCPYCHQRLDTTPKRKVVCPHCKRPVYVRMGELVTDDEAQTRDLLGYLAQLDIERKQFDKARADLSKRFSITASVHDTAWSILNGIISKTRNPLV